MYTPPANNTHKTPERRIEEALGMLKSASLNNQYLHLSQKYAYSLAKTAVVVCYVTCPEAIACEIRQAVDEAVEDVFGEHGLTLHKPQ